MPIKSFVHKGLEKFYEAGSKKGIQPHHAKRLEIILVNLDAAIDPENMNLPGFYFHQLHPADAEVYSVKVNGNYRITFRFVRGGQPEDVNYEDYH